MNIIEKLESLGKNSIQLEECFSEGRWIWEPPASAETRMCRRTSFGRLMRARTIRMW